jgi:hypothetical protein
MLDSTLTFANEVGGKAGGMENNADMADTQLARNGVCQRCLAPTAVDGYASAKGC